MGSPGHPSRNTGEASARQHASSPPHSPSQSRVCCGQSPSSALVGSCCVLLGEGGCGAAVALHFGVRSMSTWPRASRSIDFLPSPALIADGPGRGQRPGSCAGPLVTAAQVDVTDASLMAIIAPSHFTRPLPQPQISREWLFNRQSIAFYDAATAARMELWGPSCHGSGRHVPLLVSSWAVQGYGCGRCSLSSLGQCQRTACVSGVFWGLLGLSTAGVEYRAARKVEALPLPLSSLVSPAALLSLDLGLPILISYPKFPSLRCRSGMCC